MKYIRLSEVISATPSWLWYPYIPAGKISLIVADPGVGKTFFSLYLAAKISSGQPFFGEDEGGTPAVVVYQTAEDGIADTIKPRLEQMKPNFDNIIILDESKGAIALSDIKKIEEIMIDLHPRMMVFDPLQAYLSAEIDINRANEIRPVLANVAQIAEKYNCAILFCMHNNKSTQKSAVYKALGSVDIPAVARSMLWIGRDPLDNNSRLLCHEKASLSEKGCSLRFIINPENGGVEFLGYSNLSYEDIQNFPIKRTSIKCDEVQNKIMLLFRNKDELEIKNITSLCSKLGCSKDTLYKAANSLGIQKQIVGFGSEKRTVWKSPKHCADN